MVLKDSQAERLSRVLKILTGNFIFSSEKFLNPLHFHVLSIILANVNYSTDLYECFSFDTIFFNLGAKR